MKQYIDLYYRCMQKISFRLQVLWSECCHSFIVAPSLVHSPCYIIMTIIEEYKCNNILCELIYINFYTY